MKNYHKNLSIKAVSLMLVHTFLFGQFGLCLPETNLDLKKIKETSLENDNSRINILFSDLGLNNKQVDKIKSERLESDKKLTILKRAFLKTAAIGLIPLTLSGDIPSSSMLGAGTSQALTSSNLTTKTSEDRVVQFMGRYKFHWPEKIGEEAPAITIQGLDRKFPGIDFSDIEKTGEYKEAVINGFDKAFSYLKEINPAILRQSRKINVFPGDDAWAKGALFRINYYFNFEYGVYSMEDVENLPNYVLYHLSGRMFRQLTKKEQKDWFMLIHNPDVNLLSQRNKSGNHYFLDYGPDMHYTLQQYSAAYLGILTRNDPQMKKVERSRQIKYISEIIERIGEEKFYNQMEFIEKFFFKKELIESPQLFTFNKAIKLIRGADIVEQRSYLDKLIKAEFSDEIADMLLQKVNIDNLTGSRLEIYASEVLSRMSEFEPTKQGLIIELLDLEKVIDDFVEISDRYLYDYIIGSYEQEPLFRIFDYINVDKTGEIFPSPDTKWWKEISGEEFDIKKIISSLPQNQDNLSTFLFLVNPLRVFPGLGLPEHDEKRILFILKSMKHYLPDVIPEGYRLLDVLWTLDTLPNELSDFLLDRFTLPELISASRTSESELQDLGPASSFIEKSIKILNDSSLPDNLQKYFKDKMTKISNSLIITINRLHDEGEFNKEVKLVESLKERTLYALLSRRGGELYTSSFQLIYDKWISRIKDENVRFAEWLNNVDKNKLYLSSFITTLSQFDALESVVKDYPELLDDIWPLFTEERLSENLFDNLMLLSPTFEGVFTTWKEEAKIYFERGMIKTFKMAKGRSKTTIGFILRRFKDSISLGNRSEVENITKNIKDVTKSYLSPPYDTWFKSSDTLRVKLYFHQRNHFDLFRNIFKGDMYENINGYKETLSDNGQVAVLRKRVSGRMVEVIISLEPPQIANDIEDPSIQIIGHRGHSFEVRKTFTGEGKLPYNKLFFIGSCGGFRDIVDLVKDYPQALFVATTKIGIGDINNIITYYMLESLAHGKLNWRQIKDDIELHIKERIKPYIFPSDITMLVKEYWYSLKSDGELAKPLAADSKAILNNIGNMLSNAELHQKFLKVYRDASDYTSYKPAAIDFDLNILGNDRYNWIVAADILNFYQKKGVPIRLIVSGADNNIFMQNVPVRQFIETTGFKPSDVKEGSKAISIVSIVNIEEFKNMTLGVGELKTGQAALLGGPINIALRLMELAESKEEDKGKIYKELASLYEALEGSDIPTETDIGLFLIGQRDAVRRLGITMLEIKEIDLDLLKSYLEQLLSAV